MKAQEALQSACRLFWQPQHRLEIGEIATFRAPFRFGSCEFRGPAGKVPFGGFHIIFGFTLAERTESRQSYVCSDI